jgi:hypothetical protein
MLNIHTFKINLLFKVAKDVAFKLGLYRLIKMYIGSSVKEYSRSGTVIVC